MVGFAGMRACCIAEFVAKAAVAVDREEYVQVQVCICCNSHCAEPVPEGLVRGGETFSVAVWRIMGYAAARLMSWLRRSGGNAVGNRRLAGAFFLGVCDVYCGCAWRILDCFTKSVIYEHRDGFLIIPDRNDFDGACAFA